MKLNAVGVTSKNIKHSVDFYKTLGFEFPEFKDEDQHVESIPNKGSIRLMIDSEELVKSIIGETPRPSNHSTFAIEYNNPKEVDTICEILKSKGFEISKEPWDAFWGQRYAIVKDTDGYMVDLYAFLNTSNQNE